MDQLNADGAQICFTGVLFAFLQLLQFFSDFLQGGSLKPGMAGTTGG